MAKKASKSKQETSTLSEDAAKLKAVLASLEKQHGEGVIQTLSGTPSFQRFAAAGAQWLRRAGHRSGSDVPPTRWKLANRLRSRPHDRSVRR